MEIGSLLNIGANRNEPRQPSKIMLSPVEDVGEVVKSNEVAFPKNTTTSPPNRYTMGRAEMVNRLEVFFTGTTGKIILFVILASILSYFFS